MANRVNSYLSDDAVYASCPEMFPIPQKQALNMFTQPDEEFRALQGVKPEKYLRTPPRPQTFNIMATNLARQYQTQEGVGVAIRNLNNQFRQDIRHPVRLPGVSFPPPNPPNRPNVLTQNVPINQVLLDLAAQVRQLGGDAAQQRIVNAQQLAALQALTSQGIATQQQQAQVQAQIQNPIQLINGSIVLVKQLQDCSHQQTDRKQDDQQLDEPQHPTFPLFLQYHNNQAEHHQAVHHQVQPI